MDDRNHAPPSWLPNSNCFWEVGLVQHEYAEMDLKQALLRTTLELESTRMVAQEELKKLEAQSLHLANLLQIVTKERDEARHHCHSLLLLLSNSNPNSISNPNPSPNNLEESSNTASSSEEEEEESSNLTSPAAVRERGLPEKGRLVEAVMRAGPLLQSLLLAGPLPQWRHPPPAMQSFEIPPVSINVNPTSDEKKKKRKRDEGKPPPPPTMLNTNSSSPEINASTKFHQMRNRLALIIQTVGVPS